ncbi:MAG: cation-transporting P-type ATPase [Candidatus Levybacteria bacterium]|nr:cation-transporting P-type ATPase [Candidatus Levybacteria bacterium]
MERIAGLTSAQYNKLFKEFGPNKLPEPKIPSPVSLLVDQFKNLFSAMLITAIVLSFIVGDSIDAFLILTILILNVGLSFWQEYKASREISLLRKYEPPESRVIRNAHEQEVLSESLVPGDIVILESGDKIPADGILIEAFGLFTNESSLTGESAPVGKSLREENRNLFLGTWITNGNGKMRVEKTGRNTKFGKIALGLGVIKEESTPLEISLNSLAVKISFIIVSVALFLALLDIWRGIKILDVFISSIALIIAAVPEGLPAIITVLLALGVRRMYRKKSLVRRMSSIENLGTTDVILIDKTGTITKNEMALRNVELKNEEDRKKFIEVSVLCNAATLVAKEADSSSFDILGDNMEGALLVWAQKHGAKIDDMREQFKKIKEIPFDSKRKMMSVLVKRDNKFSLLSKGAPSVIFGISKLTDKEKRELENDTKKMAEKGLRVLAFAYKDLSGKSQTADLEHGLTFLGLGGIADEPRPEAKEAIEKARAAGIEIIMVTGDNALTAKAISEEVGLLKKEDEVITGDQLDELDENQLKERLSRIRIYARVNPEHKLRLVEAFQKIGKVVAVTGDGVNDSLALKKAHIGISMGRTGTDVAKEASDIVILDDNLSTIVMAVEQGRLIYKNILKVVRFLLTGNLSEVLLIATVTLLGFPTPLLPAQILWINFVTDGLPAISLAAEKGSGREMLFPPRGRDHSLFDLKTLRFISFFGILIAAVNILTFLIGANLSGIEYARRITFTVMIVSQMALVLFVIRRGSPFTSNKYLLLSVVIVLLVQMIILTFPPIRHIFGV